MCTTAAITGKQSYGEQGAEVVISAGEASGDWVGARLGEALRGRQPGLRLTGIGGPRMAAAGVELFTDSSAWGAIGVWEAAVKAPGVWQALRAARRRLAERPPAGLVLIDCGAFNLPLARQARRLGVRSLYYFPPGSWSRRLRSPELGEVADVVATPFPWSRDLLRGGRARVEWVGHPVVEAARPQLRPEEAAARYGINTARPTIALAPGSRQQEMRYVLPVLAQAAGLLCERFPGLQVVVPVAPTVSKEAVGRALRAAAVQPVLLEGMDYDGLQLAQAAAVCSGTATLEFACLGVPMVVVYRASRATTLQYRLMRGLLGGQRLAAMPNILAGREVVPELLGSAARPAAVAEAVGRLLADPARREEVRAGLKEAATALGPPGASARTAELVLELIGTGEAARVAAG